MDICKKIIKAIGQPVKTFYTVLIKLFGRWMSDKFYLSLLYRMSFGKKLNWKNPQTFSEKLQWLKLYNRRPEYTTMVDKAAVKDYVASVIGTEYIIPTLGIWDNVDDIEWDKLPDRFVLKTTHDSGSVVICSDKNHFDKKVAIKKLSKSLNNDYFWKSREWPYKNVPHRIIAEQYIAPAPDTNDLPDYKFFCFDGEVKALFIATERHKEGEDVKFDFFDADFNHLPIKQIHDNAEHTPLKPHSFELMKGLASILSKGLPFVRVDFYEIGEKILFGELTFFHHGGLVPFHPNKWDLELGKMIKLPEINNG